MKTVPTTVKLNSLRLLTKRTVDTSLYFDQDRFLVKDAHAVAAETLSLLLQRMPLLVDISEKGKIKTYHVIFGSRLFNLAAQVLENNCDIEVEVIQDATKQEIEQMRYLDVTVFPVLHSLSLPSSGVYDLITASQSHVEAWHASTKAAFADALGVSRSLLSTKPDKRKSGDTCDKQSSPA